MNNVCFSREANFSVFLLGSLSLFHFNGNCSSSQCTVTSVTLDQTFSFTLTRHHKPKSKGGRFGIALCSLTPNFNTNTVFSFHLHGRRERCISEYIHTPPRSLNICSDNLTIWPLTHFFLPFNAVCAVCFQKELKLLHALFDSFSLLISL